MIFLEMGGQREQNIRLPHRLVAPKSDGGGSQMKAGEPRQSQTTADG
jgi:hypothetical protein